MAKYSSEEKIQAALRYINGTESLYTIARSIGTDDKSILNWVRQYEYHGVNQVSENSGYSDGIYLVGPFRLYKKFDTGEQFEKFVNFLDDHDLEEITMKEVSDWVKKCFDKAMVTLPLPIYFRLTDEEDSLNLVIGEWENQMEIEL